jgi:alpha-L-rhamnosidase
MVNAIADDIGKWNGHQSTGWRATRELFDMLSRHGQIDLAAKLMFRTEFPSFGKMLESGSGTLHEYWGLPNSPFPARGSFMQNEGNTAACAWFPQALAGIRPSLDGPGFKRFTVEPRLPADLDHAEFRYRSPYGEIVSGWRKEATATRFTVRVPPDSTCDFHLPAAAGTKITESGKPLEQASDVAIKNRTGDRIQIELPAGRYEFLVEQGAQ